MFVSNPTYFSFEICWTAVFRRAGASDNAEPRPVVGGATVGTASTAVMSAAPVSSSAWMREEPARSLSFDGTSIPLLQRTLPATKWVCADDLRGPLAE